MKKRLVSILLVLVMVLGMVPDRGVRGRNRSVYHDGRGICRDGRGRELYP